MRIRFWLYLTFGIFSILPLMLMGYWVHYSQIQNEITRAGKSQLILAETHADTIERYLTEQIAAFDGYLVELAQANFDNPTLSPEIYVDIRKILIINQKKNSVIASHSLLNSHLPIKDNKTGYGLKNSDLLNAVASKSKTKVTSLIKQPNGENLVYLIREQNGYLIAGELDTKFFTMLASGIRFGGTGHAAIFDAKGKLVAHPNKNWQATGKDISRLDPVKLAQTGQSGIVNFHSPAVNAAMVAGVAHVGLNNWGIMIPREASEITAEIGIAKKSSSIIFAMLMAAILLGTILVSNFISKPLERLNHLLKKIGKDGDLGNFELSGSTMMPTENFELEKSFSQMAANLHQAHGKMKKLAYSDAVTGLPNREAFTSIVDQSLKYMAKQKMNGTMLFIDIEKFKEINDSHGHRVGDQVLRCLAARFGSILEIATGTTPTQILEDDLKFEGKPKACLARFGGDEFVVFIPENDGLNQLRSVSEQILEAMEIPIQGLSSNISLSGHVGLASFPEHGLTSRDLVKKADIAVFHAKKMGKERIQHFGDGTGEQTIAELRRDVHNAIHNEEMELYYQPKINTTTNTVKSVEALIRWFHPQKGLISPADFIPAIEKSDTTNDLGEWVVRRACHDMKKWEKQGHHLSIAVNIASRQFISTDFVERIHNIVADEGCDPTRFEIEVTEETALSCNNSASNVINKLHKLGFKVSLDDYGRGYSNLTRLSELQVDTLKIDGPLTARLTRDERTRVIYEATINMARGLNCDTVAEGVETAEEVAILIKLGCTQLQGFYFATPMPFTGVTNWIEKRQATPVHDLQERIRVAV